ncbi:dienelactone hydrolase family protein [Clostridiaceae bacterium M8S5]|nr:dienelactone hydrolase family protein [Clostridiaceae bacterium M8S5]
MAIRYLLDGINSIDDWEEKKEQIKKNFYSIIGNPPMNRNTRKMKIIDKEILENYTRLKIEYLVCHDDKVFAYLLIPNTNMEKYPAVVVMHQFQDTNIGKKEPAGIEGNKNLFIGHELVLRGYVVLIPDYLTAGERVIDNQLFNSKYFYEKHPQWSIIGKNLEDSFSAIDILVSLDYVDENKIGVIGHSLGGHNSLLSFAFDERVKVGVSNCGFSVLSEEEMVMEWVDDTYNFMPAMKQYLSRGNKLPFDFHEIAGLICPRPWLNVSAYYDDAYGNQEFLSQVGNMLYRLYDLYDESSNFAYLMHGSNHTFPLHVRELSYSWLDNYLK